MILVVVPPLSISSISLHKVACGSEQTHSIWFRLSGEIEECCLGPTPIGFADCSHVEWNADYFLTEWNNFKRQSGKCAKYSVCANNAATPFPKPMSRRPACFKRTTLLKYVVATERWRALGTHRFSDENHLAGRSRYWEGTFIRRGIITASRFIDESWVMFYTIILKWICSWWCFM